MYVFFVVFFSKGGGQAKLEKPKKNSLYQYQCFVFCNLSMTPPGYCVVIQIEGGLACSVIWTEWEVDKEYKSYLSSHCVKNWKKLNLNSRNISKNKMRQLRRRRHRPNVPDTQWPNIQLCEAGQTNLLKWDTNFPTIKVFTLGSKSNGLLKLDINSNAVCPCVVLRILSVPTSPESPLF